MTLFCSEPRGKDSLPILLQLHILSHLRESSNCNSKIKRIGILKDFFLQLTGGKQMYKTNEKLLKNQNVAKVLETIKKSKGISRADLAKITNLTPAGISKIIQKLINISLIVELGEAESTGGRPAKILKLNKMAGNIISLYLAPDYIEIILYDLEIQKLYQEKLKIWIRTKEKILENTIKLIEKVKKISTSEILGVGIAVNGLVDSKTGFSLYSPHYKWQNINLVSTFNAAVNLNCYVENDVRAMAMGEKSYGIAQNIDNFIVINIENGVGSALYLNNSIFSGTHNGAGEFGHIPIEGNTLRCNCGKKGCLETLVTNDILEEKYFNLSGKNLQAFEIYERYKNSDEFSKILVEEIAVTLAKGLVPLVNILNPHSIILNGEINRGGEILYKFIKKELKKRTFGNLNELLEIRCTFHENESVHKGCANLVLTNFF